MNSTASAIRRNAPRFGSDRAGMVPHARLAGPMPWVIAIMITLTVMAAGAGLALSNLAANAKAEIAGGLTVQIVEGAPAERERQAEVAVALLSNHEDVIDVHRVPDAELAALLEPYSTGAKQAPAAHDHPEKAIVIARIAGDALARITVLRDLGLGYLSLDRSTPTLSPGELQRLRVRRQHVRRAQRIGNLTEEEPPLSLAALVERGGVQRLAQQDRGEGGDKAGLLCNGNEPRRRYKAKGWVLPAGEAFQQNRLIATGIDDRLEGEEQFLLKVGRTQAALDQSRFAHGFLMF